MTKDAGVGMTRQAFKALAMSLASGQGITLSGHCRQRMRERDITMGEIINCIRAGQVLEDPYVDIRGSHQASMVRRLPDRTIEAALCIDVARGLIVVTVF